MRAVRQYLRCRGFADYPDLLTRRSNEVGDDHRDHRVTNVFDQCLFHIARELGRCPSQNRKVFDKWRRNLPIGPDGNAHGKLRVAPYDDVDRIEGADFVVIVGACRTDWRRGVWRNASSKKRREECTAEPGDATKFIRCKHCDAFRDRHHDFLLIVSKPKNYSIDTTILRHRPAASDRILCDFHASRVTRWIASPREQRLR